MAQKLNPTKTKQEMSRFNIKEEITFDNGKYKLEITPHLATSTIEEMLKDYLNVLSEIESKINDFDLSKNQMPLFWFMLIKNATNYYTKGAKKKLSLEDQLAHFSLLSELNYISQIIKQFPEDEIEKLTEMYSNMWDMGLELMKQQESIEQVLDGLENREIIQNAFNKDKSEPYNVMNSTETPVQ